MFILRRFNEAVNLVLEWFLIVGFAAMTLIIFLQVIFRYFLMQSLSWSEEVARYLFVWLTFLGASVVARSRSHITVESVIHRIPGKTLRAVFKIVAELLTLVFLYVLLVEGLDATMEIIDLDQASPSMPWFLLGWVYFAIPLGSLFMGLNIVEQIVDIWRERNAGKEPKHG